MTTKTVDFVKWRDPMVPADLYDEFYPPDEDGYEETRAAFADHERPRPTPYRGPLVAGPTGFVPLTDANAPGRNYKFWTAHTNFVLTDGDVARLNGVDGVEVLRVFTRYRFWFAVGQAFPDEPVKAAVRAALCGRPGGAPAADPVGALERLARARHPHWAVVRGPAGLAVVGGETVDEARGKVGDAAVVAASWEGRRGR